MSTYFEKLLSGIVKQNAKVGQKLDCPISDDP